MLRVKKQIANDSISFSLVAMLEKRNSERMKWMIENAMS